MAKNQVIIRLDEDVKKQFKAACAIDGVSMEGQIGALILEYLEKRKKTGEI